MGGEDHNDLQLRNCCNEVIVFCLSALSPILCVSQLLVGLRCEHNFRISKSFLCSVIKCERACVRSVDKKTHYLPALSLGFTHFPYCATVQQRQKHVFFVRVRVTTFPVECKFPLHFTGDARRPPNPLKTRRNDARRFTVSTCAHDKNEKQRVERDDGGGDGDSAANAERKMNITLYTPFPFQ